MQIHILIPKREKQIRALELSKVRVKINDTYYLSELIINYI